jgi:serine/threonine protein kinase
VYRSDQPLLKRMVVVKVLNERRRHDRESTERFLREAQLASQLDHPYAAHIYSFGVSDEDGLFWIAMEFVAGITVHDWLTKHGPMPLETFVPFFEHLAEVVQAAHKRGIVHRDLKPSNVMMIESDGRLLPKLLDFGIAKGDIAAVAEDDVPIDINVNEVVTSLIRPNPRRRASTNTDPNAPEFKRPGLTGAGAGMGSLAYMSPEQWDNARAVGPAADVYSLGIVAYEALTGRVPFTGANVNEYRQLHRSAAVPRLGDRFSPDVDRVIRRALAKRPDDRHGNALELATELWVALKADPREQIRALTQRWLERKRSPDLLARGQVLADLESWMRRAPFGVLNDAERAYIATSQRRARHAKRMQVGGAAFLAAGVLGAAAYQMSERTRGAERVAAATATQAEVEQGRSALLHGEPDAELHLAEAFRRDPAPSTAFMLARARQPK